MMIKRLILLFSGILILLTPAQDKAEQQEKWRASLGSRDYETRRLAMTEIWGEGGDALDFLESLVEGNDPELTARALTVVRKVKLGITPETPEDVVKLIDQYFVATDSVKVSVIEKLSAAKEYDVLLRLRKLEESPDVLRRMDEIVAKFLPEIVRGHLNEGKVKLAIEVLTQSNQFSHLVHYAHLLDRAGGLDDEIERLSEAESAEDQARYLVCLRVKGQSSRLQEAAKKLGDQDAEIVSALAMGDHVPYLESILESRNPTLSNRHYIDWTLANQRGDEAAQKKAYDALVYLSGQKPEQNGARLSLLRMGYGDVVLESLEPSEDMSRIGYFLGHEDYAAAQKVIGFPNGEAFDEWLADLALKAREEIEKDGTSSELNKLVAAIEFLEERGLVEKAAKSAEMLFDLIRPSDDLNPYYYASQIYFSAPLSTCTAIAKEIDKHRRDLDEFLKVLPLNTDENLWLYRLLEEIEPERATRERLLLTMSFSSRRLLVEQELYLKARDQVFNHIAKEDEPGASLTNLLVLLVNRNREEDLLKVMAALSDAGNPNHLFTALVAIDGDRLKEAGESLEKIESDSSTMIPELLYQKGLVLKRAAMAGGGGMMKNALLLSDGSVESFRSFAMEHMRHGEVKEAYQLMRKALLRSAPPRDSMQYQTRNSVIEELATEAVTLGMWRDALAYREVAALYSPYARVSRAIFEMRPRFQILIARGAVAMEKGDIAGAVVALSRAHEILPRDGYLANDFFPLLRQLGLHELHDQLFAKSARDCRENIRLFPKDDNAYNNFAWLASRANRCLDEAEEYLKRALEMNPESAAYLDTMGEIYFARQNRKEAVAWSTKSLQNDVLGNERSRWELQYQHRRFKSGGFPPK